ncbi:MAG: glycosyltransferase family 9 protein [Acidobacteria bacterium]|nr:glycosyltransferase family 9 protein [Acidobacteriota bacterium]
MKIMIRVPNWVGDAVMAEPALRQLRRTFGEAQITFVARPWVAGLFDGENLYDEMLPVIDTSGVLSSTQQFIHDVRLLKQQQFDCGILLTNSFGTALRARLAGVGHLAGYATDGRGALLHTVVPFEPEYRTRHQVFYYLNLAAVVDRRLAQASRTDLPNPQPQLHATPESLAAAQRLLAAEGIATVDHPPSAISSKPSAINSEATTVTQFSIGKAQPSAADKPEAAAFVQSRKPQAASRKRLLVLNPGATNSRAKQWLAERFAAVADQVAERDGLHSLIIGTAGDVERANEVARLMRTQVVNLAGRTSIAELKGVLSLAALLISNDTGAAHVAAALGVPTIVVFGPTEHFATRPLAAKVAIMRHAVECSPCMLKDCPIDHRCMTGVETDEVYAAAKRLLLMSDK